jgi:uncharacterized membrane protein YfcA
VNIDLYKTIAGVIVGFIIGLTGMGGGALMTPVLVLMFGVSPGTAVSADVVTSLLLKPFGGGVHIRRGTVNWRLVRWLMAGSMPAAFVGAYLLHRVVGEQNGHAIKTILGYVLIAAAAAIVAKLLIQAHRKQATVSASMDPRLVRPVPTLVVGAVGGAIVGMTSVGSGSLMIVALMLMYPLLPAREMVGTDLVQAIPLVGAAALGHYLFGSLDVSVIASVLIGAIPAVVVGAHFSSRGADQYIRPILALILIVSSLGLLGITNGWLLLVAALGVLVLAALWMRGYGSRRRQRQLIAVGVRTE